MFNRLNQFKETLSQELNGAKDGPISQIEKNAGVLKTETPSVEKMDFFGTQSDQPQEDTNNASSGASATPTPNQDQQELELEAKLKKFAKYEEKYPQLLKAYRLEKKKGELVKVYEQILSENTPISSITEPQELISFIEGLNQRSTLIKQELDRVTDSFSRLRKKNTATTEELDTAKKRIAELEEELKTLDAKVTALEAVEQKYNDLAAQAQGMPEDSKAQDSSLRQELEDAQIKLEKLDSISKERDEALSEIKRLQDEAEKLKEAKAEAEAHSSTEATGTQTSQTPHTLAKSAPVSGATSKKKKKKGGKGPTQASATEAKPAQDTSTPADPSTSSGKITEEIAALNSKAENLESQIKELTDTLSAKDCQIEELEVALGKFKTETPQLHLKIGDLEREVKDMTSKNAELTTAKESLEQSISALKKDHNDAQEKLRHEINGQIKQKDTEIQKARLDKGRMEALEVDLVEQRKSASEALQRVKVLESERNELTGKLQSMSSRFSTAESEAASAKLSQESLVRQLEEARLRVSEATSKIDLMQDEVNDAHRQAQERLQETIVMRSLINDRQGDRDLSLAEAQRTIASLRAERDQLELDAESISRRLIRDTEPLKREISDLKEQLQEAKAQLKGETQKSAASNISKEPLHKPQPPTQLQDTGELEKLRISLEQAQLEAREASRANKLLKQASEDAQERLQRLQKTNSALSDELEQVKTAASSRRSSVTESPPNQDQKNAYTKNVLLGFLEHKEQRKQLMPVLATLLQFEPGDEQRIWGSL